MGRNGNEERFGGANTSANSEEWSSSTDLKQILRTADGTLRIGASGTYLPDLTANNGTPEDWFTSAALAPHIDEVTKLMARGYFIYLLTCSRTEFQAAISTTIVQGNCLSDLHNGIVYSASGDMIGTYRYIHTSPTRAKSHRTGKSDMILLTINPDIIPEPDVFETYFS